MIVEIMTKKWIRIGDLDINCPVCQKPDWCMVSSDGKYAKCSRIPEYSQKGTVHEISKIKVKVNGSKAGYYTPINWDSLNTSYMRNCESWRVQQFGALKGLKPKSLLRLGIGFDGEYYTFPVRNENFDIVGIQRQNQERKLMVKGSKIGVFLPTNHKLYREPLVITEGTSDTAAALDLGLNAVGRLNNSSGNKIIMNLCDVSIVIIMSDNDENRAGQNGAYTLGNALKGIGKRVKVIIPPYKDLRKWSNKESLNKEMLLSYFEKVMLL